MAGGPGGGGGGGVFICLEGILIYASENGLAFAAPLQRGQRVRGNERGVSDRLQNLAERAAKLQTNEEGAAPASLSKRGWWELVAWARRGGVRPRRKDSERGPGCDAVFSAISMLIGTLGPFSGRDLDPVWGNDFFLTVFHSKQMPRWPGWVRQWPGRIK